MSLLRRGEFNIGADDLQQWLEEGFITACRLELSQKRHKRMLKEAKELLWHRHRNGSISIKGIYALYDGGCFCEGTIHAENHQVCCNAFSLIDKARVRNVLFVMMTTGIWNSESKAREQLYLDIWGNVLIDSARIWLEQQLNKTCEKGCYVSPPYGPGYYGMDITTTRIFGEILQAERIGINVLESGIMVPQKTQASVYFITESDEGFPYPGCEYCAGNLRNCQFCNVSNYPLV